MVVPLRNLLPLASGEGWGEEIDDDLRIK